MTDAANPRREFLTRLTASGLVLASAAMDPLVAAAQVAATPTQGQATQWDDSWATALAAGKYKAVVDSPELEEGNALWIAAAFLEGCKAALGAADGEVQVAVVIRHAAICMAYNDTIWSKYPVGKKLKVKDPATKKWATRNPYLSVPEGNTEVAWMKPYTLTALGEHGVSYPSCNRATRFFASQIAEWSKQERNVVYDELKANLIPGARLQPTGLYATMRAQQVGAAFMRG